MAEIHPALRATLDQELSSALAGLLHKAAEHDGKDVIEATADLTNDLLAGLTPAQLAVSAASLAIWVHRLDANGGLL